MNEDEGLDTAVRIAELYVSIEWLKVQAEAVMPDAPWSWKLPKDEG